MRNPLTVIAGLLVLMLVYGSVFVVDQREQALILQLGEVVGVEGEPGLHMKLPMVQDVVFYDNRVLGVDMQSQEVIAFDRKRLIVDAYAKYKITDPLKYYKAVRTDRDFSRKFGPVLESSIREEIGRVKVSDLLLGARDKVMESVRQSANEVASNYGIDIIDIRIVRTDLPQENSDAIYERMKAQHEKEARQTRAEGAEESLKIKSNADKDRRVVLAEAQKTAEILRGEGDATASKIFADAYGRDPEFYKFYRTMQAYRASMAEKGTRMILSPDSEFMRYFHNMDGNSRRGQ